MIAAIVPAHNEQETIGECLYSLVQASHCPGLGGEAVLLVIALDACSDATGSIACRFGATTVFVNERNVGAARRAGAAVALQSGARWLAFTDADTTVAPDWLSTQLGLGHDAVCGTVAVEDWGSYGALMRQHHDATYNDADGHRHIHGANLGVSATAYRRAGGFRPLASSEDVALVESLCTTGASIAWSAAPRVVTSARRAFRAPAGFGATLLRVESERAAAVDGSAR
jgi:glycosyltransferase involved in cell wall biosynthesis